MIDTVIVFAGPVVAATLGAAADVCTGVEAATGVLAEVPAATALPPRLNCSTRGCNASTPALIAPLRTPRAWTTPWPASFAPVGRLSCAQATRQSPAVTPAACDSEPAVAASTTTLPPGPSRSDRPRGVRVIDTVIVFAGPVAAARIGAVVGASSGAGAATGARAEVDVGTALPPRLNCSTRGRDVLTPALMTPLRTPRACTTPWSASFAHVGRLSCEHDMRQSPAAMPAACDSEPAVTASTTMLPPAPSRSDKPRGVRVTDTARVCCAADDAGAAAAAIGRALRKVHSRLGPTASADLRRPSTATGANPARDSPAISTSSSPAATPAISA